MDHPIIDSDTHINEPPDLWQKTAPGTPRDRIETQLRNVPGDERRKILHENPRRCYGIDAAKRARNLGYGGA